MEGQRPASPSRDADSAAARQKGQPEMEGVGDEDPQGAAGFHVGLAPANLRPPKGVDAGALGLSFAGKTDSTGRIRSRQ